MLWADVFQQIESHKEALGIEDYSVSQTTLDQVCVGEGISVCGCVLDTLHACVVTYWDMSCDSHVTTEPCHVTVPTNVCSPNALGLCQLCQRPDRGVTAIRTSSNMLRCIVHQCVAVV